MQQIECGCWTQFGNVIQHCERHFSEILVAPDECHCEYNGTVPIRICPQCQGKNGPNTEDNYINQHSIYEAENWMYN